MKTLGDAKKGTETAGEGETAMNGRQSGALKTCLSARQAELTPAKIFLAVLGRVDLPFNFGSGASRKAGI
jgi:hypothetical protein